MSCHIRSAPDGEELFRVWDSESESEDEEKKEITTAAVKKVKVDEACAAAMSDSESETSSSSTSDSSGSRGAPPAEDTNVVSIMGEIAALAAKFKVLNPKTMPWFRKGKLAECDTEPRNKSQFVACHAPCVAWSSKVASTANVSNM